MITQTHVFIALLSLVWFIFYWIFGGVFFSIIALLRLGRIYKVRFSCLFSLSALGCAIGASLTGMKWARQSIIECAGPVSGVADKFASMFACGFIGILGSMLVWAGILVLIGFVLMMLSRTKDQAWFLKEEDDEEFEEELENE